MERHLDPLVRVLVMHVVDDVHRVDVHFGEPIHHFLEPVEHVIEIQVIALHRAVPGPNLIAGYFVAATIDCIEKTLGKVGARAEELHLLAHQHW